MSSFLDPLKGGILLYEFSQRGCDGREAGMKCKLNLVMPRNERTSATDCGCVACSSAWIFSVAGARPF